ELGIEPEIASALDGFGDVMRLQDKYRQAAQLYRQSLRKRIQLQDQPGIAQSLESSARLAAAQGHAERAIRLFGAAEKWLNASSAYRPPYFAVEHEQAVALALARLAASLPRAQAEATFNTLYAEGRALTLE